MDHQRQADIQLGSYGTFVEIRSVLSNAKISDRAKLALIALKASNTADGWYQEHQVANAVNHSKAGVRHAITELIDRGYVERQVVLVNEKATPVYRCTGSDFSDAGF